MPTTGGNEIAWRIAALKSATIPEDLPPYVRAVWGAGLICLALSDRIFGRLVGAAEPEAMRMARLKREREKARRKK